jgi:hypothetical protein
MVLTYIHTHAKTICIYKHVIPSNYFHEVAIIVVIKIMFNIFVLLQQKLAYFYLFRTKL